MADLAPQMRDSSSLSSCIPTPYQTYPEEVSTTHETRRNMWGLAVFLCLGSALAVVGHLLTHEASPQAAGLSLVASAVVARSPPVTAERPQARTIDVARIHAAIKGPVPHAQVSVSRGRGEGTIPHAALTHQVSGIESSPGSKIPNAEDTAKKASSTSWPPLVILPLLSIFGAWATLLLLNLGRGTTFRRNQIANKVAMMAIMSSKDEEAKDDVEATRLSVTQAAIEMEKLSSQNSILEELMSGEHVVLADPNPRSTSLALLKVIVPSIAAAIVAYFGYPPLCLLIRNYLDGPTLTVLANDYSQFVQNFLTVTGLLFSMLVGQTYYFLYQQQESIYLSLFEEVSIAKSLLEQTTLVCGARPMYSEVLDNISNYVKNDLSRLDLPPAILLSARPEEDPLEAILYLTSVGVPGPVYDTVKSLRAARGNRLGATQRKLPSVHFIVLNFLAAANLCSFPVLGAGTSVLASNGYGIQAVLFAILAGGTVLLLQIIGQLSNPTGGMYSVDGVLKLMIKGLEEELQMRLTRGDDIKSSISIGGKPSSR